MTFIEDSKANFAGNHCDRYTDRCHGVLWLGRCIQLNYSKEEMGADSQKRGLRVISEWKSAEKKQQGKGLRTLDKRQASVISSEPRGGRRWATNQILKMNRHPGWGILVKMMQQDAFCNWTVQWQKWKQSQSQAEKRVQGSRSEFV